MSEFVRQKDWKHAIEFVDSRRPAVLGWARSRIWISGYDVEDFIQEAYLAAVQAKEVAHQKGDPDLFERCFWVTYKSRLSRMLTDPVILASPLETYQKAPERKPNGPLDPRSKRDGIQAALAMMRPRERMVWELLLGETRSGKHTIAEVATILGVSSPRIRQIRDTGLDRVRKSFSDEGVEGVHQTVATVEDSDSPVSIRT